MYLLLYLRINTDERKSISLRIKDPGKTDFGLILPETV